MDQETLETVGERFARTAAEVDAGARSAREGLAWLVDQGLLCQPIPRPGRVVEAVRLIRAIAAASLADAVAVWSQTMVVEYRPRLGLSGDGLRSQPGRDSRTHRVGPRSTKCQI